MNRQALLHGFTRGYGVALDDGEVLFWNEAHWSRMAREQPAMSEAMTRMVLKQQAQDQATLEKSILASC